MTTLALSPSRAPATSLRRWWLATSLALACVLAWDATGLDLAVMTWISQPVGGSDSAGFALRHNWWLETVLHESTRRAALVFYGALWLMVWRPVGFFRQFEHQERLDMVWGVTAALLAITLMKRFSLTSCPWELQAFGGAASYVSHWQWGVADGGGGKCFPGGHASSALAFLALALPGLAALRGSVAHRTGTRVLLGVLLAGAGLGVVQTLRGAHYPSHTLWTAWLCWTVASAVRIGLGAWRRRLTGHTNRVMVPAA